MLGQPNYYNPYLTQYQPNMGAVNYNPTTLPSYTQNSLQTLSTTPQQYPTINGKIVESEDVVKICEVPMGGYSVFPLTDMSKVIIKNYDKNGNLQYLTYSLTQPIDEPKVDPVKDKLNEIYDYLGKLDKRLDDLKLSSPTATKKKLVEVEVDADE